MGFISANNVRVATFLRQLQTSSSHHGGISQKKSCNSSFSKWASWCAEYDRNLISGRISDVANFLAELCEKGYQCSYRSVNAYHSTIFSTHEKVDAQPVGQHPTIVRVLKGAYNQRPPLPKYSTTWEVS